MKASRYRRGECRQGCSHVHFAANESRIITQEAADIDTTHTSYRHGKFITISTLSNALGKF